MQKVQASRRKFHLLYKTTFIPTGQYYVGIHSTDEIEDGYLGSGKYISRSLKKHGRQNFKREILELLPDRASLKLREAEIVTEELMADVLCMNLMKGGSSNDREFGVTDKTRELLSIASKRAIRTKEWYEKVVATRRANNSYHHPEEDREKFGHSKGKKLSEEHKAAISAGNTGRVFTEETRAKISEGIRANKEAGLRKKPKPMSDEHREKLRQAQLGRKYSDKARAKMSEKAKVRCARNKIVTTS